MRTNSQVTDVQPGYVIANGEKIESVVTLWAAGVQASPLGKMLGAEMDKKGAIFVDPFLNPPGHPEIFVCGDLANISENGRRIPGVAQPAMQMGTHAAKEILADLAGKPRTPFHYFDKGDMATIGRHNAVADLKWPFHAHMSGLPAWVAWLTIHILFPDWLPQSHRGDAALDLDVLRAFRRAAPDHRQPEIARMGKVDR